MQRPNVGIGVIIENEKGEILVGKRTGSHAPYYSIPGGHLELGETFEQAAIKEVEEETSLKIKSPSVFCVSNNLKTYQESQLHFISVCLYTRDFSGEVKVMEVDKCESWQWVKPQEVPLPHFEASSLAVDCYLQNKFYLGQRM